MKELAVIAAIAVLFALWAGFKLGRGSKVGKDITSYRNGFRAGAKRAIEEFRSHAVLEMQEFAKSYEKDRWPRA